MSKPTMDSVPWNDLVEAAKLVGIEALPADIPLDQACTMFADAVEATPPEKESELSPLVVEVYNHVMIFKVPVVGHPTEPAPVTGGEVEEVVEEPIPEAGGERAAKKAAKEAEKAKKKAEKEAKKAEKEAEKAKKKVPGAREKDEGYAAIFRAGILAKDPEGVVIQRAFEAYKAKGFPEGKDEKWALARAKRTYHYVYAQLVSQGRIEPKPKPVKEPKKEKASAEAPASEAPTPEAAEAAEAPASEAAE